MLVGYARSSTAEQEAGLTAQLRDLKAAGCEKLFSEQVSAAAKRADAKSYASSIISPQTEVRLNEHRSVHGNTDRPSDGLLQRCTRARQ